jgi:hypothetical protein
LPPLYPTLLCKVTLSSTAFSFLTSLLPFCDMLRPCLYLQLCSVEREDDEWERFKRNWSWSIGGNIVTFSTFE